MARYARKPVLVVIVRAGRETQKQWFNIDSDMGIDELGKEINSFLVRQEVSVWKNYKDFQLEGNNDRRLLTLRKVMDKVKNAKNSVTEIKGKYLLDDGYQESYIQII